MDSNLKGFVVVFLLLAVIFANPVLAGKKAVPTIDAVFVVFGSPDTVLIMGENFGTRDDDSDSDSHHRGLAVTLGGFGALAIVSATSTEIVAELPAGLPDGDYLLAVFRGKRHVEYDLTVGAVGPQGPQGPPGAQGEQGPQGEPGLSGHEIVTRSLVVPIGEWFGVGPENATGAAVDCPAGKKVFGGGFYVNDGFALGNIRGNGPRDEDTWTVQAKNDTVVDGLRVTLFAVCAATN